MVRGEPTGHDDQWGRSPSVWPGGHGSAASKDTSRPSSGFGNGQRPTSTTVEGGVSDHGESDAVEAPSSGGCDEHCYRALASRRRRSTMPTIRCRTAWSPA